MAKSLKFKKGQKVICTHYKDKPIVIITDIVPAKVSLNDRTEVWVKYTDPEKYEKYGEWYGDLSWFKPLKKGKE